MLLLYGSSPFSNLSGFTAFPVYEHFADVPDEKVAIADEILELVKKLDAEAEKDGEEKIAVFATKGETGEVEEAEKAKKTEKAEKAKKVEKAEKAEKAPKPKKVMKNKPKPKPKKSKKKVLPLCRKDDQDDQEDDAEEEPDVDAVAKAILDDDRVSHVNIIATGSNYRLPPVVVFERGGGEGATATAKIHEGHVVSIQVTSGGSGYTSPPKVVFKKDIVCGANPVLSVQSIKGKAQAYNKIYDTHVADIKRKVAEAKVKWGPALKSIEEDKQLTAQASRVGLPPPPSLLTDKQMKQMKAELSLKPRILTDAEKALCLDLSAELKKTVDSAQFLGQQSTNIPALRPEAETQGKLASDLTAKYKTECE